MTQNKRSNPDFLNGVPELVLLQLLSRQPMYGYELVQAIRLVTNAALEFGEGCVYPILHRLEADGMLAGRRETVGGFLLPARGANPQSIRRGMQNGIAEIPKRLLSKT